MEVLGSTALCTQTSKPQYLLVLSWWEVDQHDSIYFAGAKQRFIYSGGAVQLRDPFVKAAAASCLAACARVPAWLRTVRHLSVRVCSFARLQIVASNGIAAQRTQKKEVFPGNSVGHRPNFA